jgi:hypothetical protein
LRDILLEARAQLAHVKMAANWLEHQVTEYLGSSGPPSAVEAHASDPGVQSQADFFRLALHPALTGAIVLSVFSLLEQAVLRVCERHAAYDKKGGRYWGRLPGSGALKAINYLRRVSGPPVESLLRDFDDLRLVRNQLAHRGTDFSSAPKNALAAARRHELLNGLVADPHRVLSWMLEVEGALLDALEADFIGPADDTV